MANIRAVLWRKEGWTHLAKHDLELFTDFLALGVGASHQQADDGVFISAWRGREGEREGRIVTIHLSRLVQTVHSSRTCRSCPVVYSVTYQYVSNTQPYSGCVM